MLDRVKPLSVSGTYNGIERIKLQFPFLGHFLSYKVHNYLVTSNNKFCTSDYPEIIISLANMASLIQNPLAKNYEKKQNYINMYVFLICGSDFGCGYPRAGGSKTELL